MRRLLVIALIALAAPMAPAAAPARKAVVEKSAAEKAKAPAQPAASKAAPSKAAARSDGPFDARDPQSLIALLGSLDARATVSERTESEVKLQVETPSYSFGAEFADCSAGGKGCKGLALSASSADQRATLAQLNGFNQTSFACRLFQDRMGKVHVVYSTLLSPTVTREDMRTHLGAWQGCLASFGAFLQDPNGYLATAP